MKNKHLRPSDVPLGFQASMLTDEQAATLAALYLRVCSVLADKDTPRSLVPLARYYHSLIDSPDPLEIEGNYL